MKHFLLHLIFFLQSPLIFSQNPNLNQFYYSDYTPIELNETIDQRFDKIYNRYIQRYGKDKNVDAKVFVSNHNYFLDHLNRSGKIFYGDEISTYLNQLKDFILSGNEMKSEITVYLTDFPYLNAFTNDFGNIYVNVGTLAKLNSEEELLYLLAHEISHILLRHSHKSVLFENTSKSSKDKLSDQTFKRHEFSREHEFEADLKAFELLKDRVDAKSDLHLMHLLEDASNPIFPGRTNLDLLFGKNAVINQKLLELYEKDSASQVLFPISDKDSLSTHPSVEKRISRLELLLQTYTPPLTDYPVIRNFSEVKSLACNLMVNSLIEAEDYIEALDLILKMRSKGDSKWLMEHQINVLALLSFSKYSYTYFDLILNNTGNSCNDVDFLRFRKLILGLRNVDFLTLALNNIELLKEQELNPKTELAWQKIYQKFFSENESIFDFNINLKTYSYDSSQVSTLMENLPDTDSPYAVLKKLEKEGYHVIDKNDSCYFLDAYIKNSYVGERYQDYIKNYQDVFLKRPQVKDLWENMLNPSAAAYKYNKGDFERSSDFDTKHKSLIIRSDYLYFKSRSKRNYQLDYSKNQDLESKMIRFKQRYNPDQLDFTNRFGTKNTVYNNYLHKILFDWMTSYSNNELKYSPIEYEAQEYLDKENIKYIVYNLCIVNRNKGRGRANYSNYYEFYFDIDKKLIVYSTKIGTRSNPSVYTLENLIYITEYNKTQKK